jgi:hypothetical protein
MASNGTISDQTVRRDLQNAGAPALTASAELKRYRRELERANVVPETIDQALQAIGVIVRTGRAP